MPTDDFTIEFEQLPTHSKFLNLTGKQFGRYTVLGYAGRKMPNYRQKWWCQCECGEIRQAETSNLRKGTSQSCGCRCKDILRERHTKHGLSKHPLYAIWQSMMSRCYKSTNSQYHSYGERGIDVCGRWHDFETFFEDMMPRPLNTTLERINNELGYSPENCIWADRLTQNNNKRNVVLYTIGDKTQSLSQWCREKDVPYSRVRERIKHGWTFIQALTLPPIPPSISGYKGGKKRHEIKGELPPPQSD